MLVPKLCSLLILFGLKGLQTVPFVDELCQKRLFVSYLVSIYKSNGSDEVFECTGALIHRKFVLSGGSCAAGYKRQSDMFYKAYIRKNDRFAEEHRLITDTIRDPNDQESLGFYGIVLLKLSHPLRGIYLQLHPQPTDEDEDYYACYYSEDKVIVDWRLDLSSPLGVCYKIDNKIDEYSPPGQDSISTYVIVSISNVSLPKYQSKVAVGAMFYCSGELYIHSYSYGENRNTIITNTTTADSVKNADLTSVFVIVKNYDEFIRDTLHKQEPYREITLQAIIPYLLLAIFLVIVLLVILFC